MSREEASSSSPQPAWTPPADIEPLPWPRSRRPLLTQPQLGKAERLILTALAGAWPDTMTKEDLAAAAGFTATGGVFDNRAGKLRTLELISGRGDLQLSNDLFA